MMTKRVRKREPKTARSNTVSLALVRVEHAEHEKGRRVGRYR
jgi:hypothetical protein